MTKRTSSSFMGTPATAPGPQGPDMLRDFSLIRHNPLAFLDKTWREYGDIVQFPIPKPPTYLINSPTGVRQVLVANGRNYGKSTIQYRALSLVTGEGLLTADTSQWQRTRPMIQPAFHQALLHDLVPITESVTQSLAQQWGQLPDGAVVDVDQFMLAGALDVVGKFLFGTDLTNNVHVITEATLSALDVVIARARVPITPPGWVPTPANRKLRRSVSVLDAAVAQMLAHRSSGQESSPTMIDVLRTAVDTEGRALTPEQIRDEIVTFIVAGHETVASALSWAWAILAADPHRADSLAAEANMAHEQGGIALEKLPLTRAFFEEVLRMYPPAWLITRRAEHQDSIDGHAIPPGALIIISPALIHRHPEVWTDAEKFMPDRFLHPYPRESFIPFGAGLRQCIGKDFAYIEGVLLLASLLRTFQIRYPEGGRIPEGEPLVTIRPRGGVKLLLTRRG
ncbi:MAG: cytochrome P450 [Candidatus Nanopelagicales bacterium]|nr:cytochrome P450 [Candidatus Nanopelagicales bacterium]MCF8551475.1 cytochrome P450 [Candidatus Nanopelagicales bacterium]